LEVQQVKLGAGPLFRAAAKSDFRGELEATAPHEASTLKANDTIEKIKLVTCMPGLLHRQGREISRISSSQELTTILQ
jgi:hypothetical protein